LNRTVLNAHSLERGYDPIRDSVDAILRLPGRRRLFDDSQSNDPKIGNDANLRAPLNRENRFAVCA